MKCKILLVSILAVVSNSVFATGETKLSKSCDNIRAEINNQYGISAVMVSQQTSPLIALLIGAKSQQNIAALESRESKLGCRALNGKSQL